MNILHIDQRRYEWLSIVALMPASGRYQFYLHDMSYIISSMPAPG
jgi:hypothetical protein